MLVEITKLDTTTHDVIEKQIEEWKKATTIEKVLDEAQKFGKETGEVFIEVDNAEEMQVGWKFINEAKTQEIQVCPIQEITETTTYYGFYYGDGVDCIITLDILTGLKTSKYNEERL